MVDDLSNMNLSALNTRLVVEASNNVPTSLLDQFSKNRSVDDPARAVLLAFYGTLVFIGAAGNALVVLSVVRKPIMRTVRNMFIVNLAVSDTLVCAIGTPLTLVELLTKHWPLPDQPFLCKATGAIQGTSIFVSTLTITAIALDRYQVIVYPTRSGLQTMGALIIMCCIWITAGALASPLFIFRTLNTHKVGIIDIDTISFCVEDWPMKHGRAIYSAISLIVQYVVPVLVVIVAHARIHRRLRGRRRSRKRTPALLIAIVVTYIVSWLPLNVFNLVADLSEGPLMDHTSMLVTYAICHMCGMSSACSNPLLYGWLNENFRKEFEEMLCFCGDRGRSLRVQESKFNRKRKPAITELTALAQTEHNINGKNSECSRDF